MKNMSTFQIVVVSFFGVCMIFGIAVFSLSKTSSPSQNFNLVVWGTMNEDVFNKALSASSIAKSKTIKVAYVKKDSSTFDTEFIESLADGKGPDIVILREDSMYKHRNKIFTIPFGSYPEEVFNSTFIEIGELFLNKEGVFAVPFMVDPLVMYWNRDMFSNNDIALPPVYWDQIDPLIEKMTHRDNNANILKSAVALGEWKNINNAKEIISMLFMQAGTPITMRNQAGNINSVLNSQFDKPVVPSQAGLNFYLKFSNPTSPSYTWNRSLPTSLNFFLSGDLGIYIGFASEIFSIQQKNSNLNFHVVSVPQIRDTEKKIVFGHLYGLALVKQSKQLPGAFTAIKALTEVNSLKSLEVSTNLPPVRRDMLADKPLEAFRSVFYSSALISRSWIDPNPTETTNGFRDMIESITSGRSRVTDSLGNLNEIISSNLK
ncbi:MAG: extracellular solute-binding protein [Parcubacteria group bacterium]